MCLIALAHRASKRYPFVLAANRDEDYERPTVEAGFWDDAPEVLGGRDALLGGSWLAITRGGRFAAVTNLRGAARQAKSRGMLVRAFVTSEVDAATFAESVAGEADQYAGFHLFLGHVGGPAAVVVYVSGGDEPRILPHGIHAISNAPEGEHWPKESLAAEAMERALRECDEVDALRDELLRFLGTSRNSGRVEDEVFITGDRYGTRSSTVIIATADEIVFSEQNYARGGMPLTRSFFRPALRDRQP